MNVVRFCTHADCRLSVCSPMHAPLDIFVPLIADDARSESDDDDYPFYGTLVLDDSTTLSFYCKLSRRIGPNQRQCKRTRD